mgnify:CR=1 FL=1
MLVLLHGVGVTHWPPQQQACERMTSIGYQEELLPYSAFAGIPITHCRTEQALEQGPNLGTRQRAKGSCCMAAQGGLGIGTVGAPLWVCSPC